MAPGRFFDVMSTWPVQLNVDALEAHLAKPARGWHRSLMVAVGVDVTMTDQRQWWVAGGRGLVKEIFRKNDDRCASPLNERRVAHAGYTFLGFVCGEAYEWSKSDLADHLKGVDLVAVSAHRSVNRVWNRRVTDPRSKRWAFQRR